MSILKKYQENPIFSKELGKEKYSKTELLDNNCFPSATCDNKSYHAGEHKYYIPQTVDGI